MTITEATTAEDYSGGRALIEEYTAVLGVDLYFQNFGGELANLRDVYGPPAGCLLLAREGAAAVGCVAVRRTEQEICEMKRLYVRPEQRGRGVGRSLAVAALARARGLGYRRMVLDTLPAMSKAQSLYESIGFREITSYYHNPLPGVRYLAVDLVVTV
ncbi:MAG: GNAT family N-acetyltransferase [Nitrospirota bacterium]